MCAICMTEPTLAPTSARFPRAPSKTGDGYVINGGKVLISRADVAGVFLTFVRFGDTPGSRGVGAVLIDRDTPGLEIGPGEETLGGENLFAVYFRDVRIRATRCWSKNRASRR